MDLKLTHINIEQYLHDACADHWNILGEMSAVSPANSAMVTSVSKMRKVGDGI